MRCLMLYVARHFDALAACLCPEAPRLSFRAFFLSVVDIVVECYSIRIFKLENFRHKKLASAHNMSEFLYFEGDES